MNTLKLVVPTSTALGITQGVTQLPDAELVIDLVEDWAGLSGIRDHVLKVTMGDVADFRSAIEKDNKVLEQSTIDTMAYGIEKEGLEEAAKKVLTMIDSVIDTLEKAPLRFYTVGAMAEAGKLLAYISKFAEEERLSELPVTIALGDTVAQYSEKIGGALESEESELDFIRWVSEEASLVAELDTKLVAGGLLGQITEALGRMLAKGGVKLPHNCAECPRYDECNDPRKDQPEFQPDESEATKIEDEDKAVDAEPVVQSSPRSTDSRGPQGGLFKGSPMFDHRLLGDGGGEPVH